MSFDIETVVNPSTRLLVPIILTLAGKKGEKTESAIFIIDLDNLNQEDIELALLGHKAVQQIGNEFFEFLSILVHNLKDVTIFVHNLGSFDGYLIIPAIARIFKQNIYVLIDANREYICIDVKINKTKISFRDSMRVFNMSLNNLAASGNIEGKTQPGTPDGNGDNLIVNRNSAM